MVPEWKVCAITQLISAAVSNTLYFDVTYAIQRAAGRVLDAETVEDAQEAMNSLPAHIIMLNGVFNWSHTTKFGQII